MTEGRKKYTGYDLLLGGLFMALAVVFPVIFHLIGLGSAFLPMFYPIVMAGYLIAYPAAIFVGFLSPLVSALITGMPPFYPPIAFIMMAEGIVLTTIPAIFYRRFKVNPWITIVLITIADRFVLFISIIMLSHIMELPGKMLSIASLIKGIPGVITMIILIPPLVKTMEMKTRFARAIE